MIVLEVSESTDKVLSANRILWRVMVSRVSVAPSVNAEVAHNRDIGVLCEGHYYVGAPSTSTVDNLFSDIICRPCMTSRYTTSGLRLSICPS